MEIVNNRGLLLVTKKFNQIASCIQKSMHVGAVDHEHDKVMVYWGLDEVIKLRELGFSKVPSPIVREYNWPGKYKPFQHQIDLASFHSGHRRCFNLSEVGTGKTAGCLWAADYLMQKQKIRRVLVVCPVSVMYTAWQADTFKLLPHRTCLVAHGPRDKRKQIINSDAEIVIINYDGVEIVANDIALGKFDLIIVDEATAYKNSQTNRWKTMRKLITTDTWVWMLTGTPAAQSPDEAYGLVKLIAPDRVPRSYGAFKDMVMNKVSTFRWIPRINADKIVHRAMQPGVRFTKDECLDLPEMMYVTRDVELTPQQKKYYTKLVKEMHFEAAGEEITAVNAAVQMNKLLQVSCGAVYSNSREIIDFDASNRLSVMHEVIEASTNKTIVFAPFTHAIDAISKYLDKHKISHAVIDGSVSAKRRAQIIDSFQNSSDHFDQSNSIDVLIIQPKAASHGITLTEASTVIWFGPTTSLETFIQANARAHRPGQKHKVTVVQLQGSQVERKLYSALSSKMDMHTKIIDLYKEELGI